jgi:hypothetical protein
MRILTHGNELHFAAAWRMILPKRNTPEEENEMWRRLLIIWVITIALCSGLKAQGNRPASDKPDPRFPGVLRHLGNEQR